MLLDELRFGVLADLRRLLASAPIPSREETEAHAAIAGVLGSAGYGFEREVPIGARDRIDFLVERDLGIEVKLHGSRNQVLRQLRRYAESDRVAALMLATSRLQLTRMPPTLAGKQLVTVPLLGAVW